MIFDGPTNHSQTWQNPYSNRSVVIYQNRATMIRQDKFLMNIIQEHYNGAHQTQSQRRVYLVLIFANLSPIYYETINTQSLFTPSMTK